MMALDLFHGKGAFSEEELLEFIRIYEQLGKHNWHTDIHLGGGTSSEIEKIINQLSQNMGNLSDRLALTIVNLAKKKTQHSGDCNIYASLVNARPEDGICTYGYGMQVMRETGDNRELYSQELKDKLMGVSIIIA